MIDRAIIIPRIILSSHRGRDCAVEDIFDKYLVLKFDRLIIDILGFEGHENNPQSEIRLTISRSFRPF
jgi:hypothetical protein